MAGLACSFDVATAWAKSRPSSTSMPRWRTT